MKIVEVTFAPGAVSAGSNISLPAGSPPIAKVVSAVIFKGHAVDEGGTATYTIGPVSATPTKVDESTITLDADVAAEDLVVLRYIPKGAIRAIGFS